MWLDQEGPKAPRTLFRDRREAGHRLANLLAQQAGWDDVVVVGLPRGGVPVAHEVADELALPLDVVVVRKLGVPGHEELAMGAIASGGIRFFDEDLARNLGISAGQIARVEERALRELEAREKLWRAGRPPVDVKGRTVIAVDDGIATGASMRVAVRSLRARGAQGVIVAVPVAPPDSVRRLATEADRVVTCETPDPFYAVGLWYRDFHEVDDQEVIKLMKQAAVE